MERWAEEKAALGDSPSRAPEPPPPGPPKAASASQQAGPAVKPLSYSEKKELESMLDRISEAEQRVAELEATLASPEFYAEQAERAGELSAELEAREAQVLALMARWEELERRKDLKR